MTEEERGDNQIFDIDFELPMFRDNILPKILSFCPLKTVCEMRMVNKSFLSICKHTAISDTLYCHGNKPLESLLQSFKFQSVVVNNSRTLDLFIDSLDHNHCIQEVWLSSKIFNMDMKKIKKLSSKKTLRTISVNGTQDFRYLKYLLCHASITDLTVRKNGTRKLKKLFEGLNAGKKLRKLTIMEVQPINDPGWETVFQESFIEELSVLKGKAPRLKTDDFKFFMKGVSKLWYLRKLDLEGFFLVNENSYLDGICEVLEKLHYLKSISLVRMSVTDEGFKKKLLPAIEGAESLESFRISWNRHKFPTLREIAYLVRRKLLLREVSCIVRDSVVDENMREWRKCMDLLIESIPHSNLVKLNCINKSVSASDDDVWNMHVKLEKALRRNRLRISGSKNY